MIMSEISFEILLFDFSLPNIYNFDYTFRQNSKSMLTYEFNIFECLKVFKIA